MLALPYDKDVANIIQEEGSNKIKGIVDKFPEFFSNDECFPEPTLIIIDSLSKIDTHNTAEYLRMSTSSDMARRLDREILLKW